MSGWRKYRDMLQEAVFRSHARHVLEADERAADNRLRMTRAEAVSLCIYLAALLVSHLWLPKMHSSARILLALLPLLPAMVIVACAVRRVLALDELQRQVELVALSIVGVGTWLVVLTGWLLQHAGMVMPPLSLVLVGMPAMHGIARYWAKRHYA